MTEHNTNPLSIQTTEADDVTKTRRKRRSDMARININPALAPFLHLEGRKRAVKYRLRQWQGESLALCRYIRAGLSCLDAVN
jgi:hypothetical protein